MVNSHANQDPEWAQLQDLDERLSKDKQEMKRKLPKGGDAYGATIIQNKQSGWDGSHN